MQFLLYFFSHRFLALTRWEAHFVKLRITNVLTFQSLRIRQFLKTRGPKIYINLGSGPKGSSAKSWLNIDGYRDRNVHFLVDLSRPLCLPSNSFDGAFSEHVLEHFTQPDGLKIAREVHRVLKNGAVFRIVVPDGEKIVRLYVEDPKALTDYRDGNAMEVVNSFFHQRYEHQFIYDFDAISAMLKKAGFSTVTKVGLLKSSNPDLLLDEPAYEWESLYVEATKGSQVDVH